MEQMSNKKANSDISENNQLIVSQSRREKCVSFGSHGVKRLWDVYK